MSTNPQQFEKALDVASQQSQANMEKIQQQRSKIQLGSITKGNLQLKSATSKFSANFSDEAVANYEVPKRSSSAPRMMPAARAAMATSLAAANFGSQSSTDYASAPYVTPSVEGGANNNLNVIRKFQLLEERIRKLDKAQSSTDFTVGEISTKLDRVADMQKQEKKMYHSLKEQLASTRTRMDFLSEELKVKHSQLSNLPFGIDGETLQDFINRKIQKATEDAIIQQRHHLQPTSSTGNCFFRYFSSFCMFCYILLFSL